MIRSARLARVVSIVAILPSFFPTATYRTSLHAESPRETEFVFQTGGIAYGVLGLVALLLIVLGRGDESETRKSALVWWAAGISSVLLQTLVIVQLTGAWAR